MAYDVPLRSRITERTPSDFDLLTCPKILSSTDFAELDFDQVGCDRLESLLMQTVQPGHSISGKGYLVYFRGEFFGVMKTKGERTIYAVSGIDASEQQGVLSGHIYGIPDQFDTILFRDHPVPEDSMFPRINIESGMTIEHIREINKPSSFDRNRFTPIDVAHLHAGIHYARLSSENGCPDYFLEIPNLVEFMRSNY